MIEPEDLVYKGSSKLNRKTLFADTLTFIQATMCPVDKGSSKPQMQKHLQQEYAAESDF